MPSRTGSDFKRDLQGFRGGSRIYGQGSNSTRWTEAMLNLFDLFCPGGWNLITLNWEPGKIVRTWSRRFVEFDVLAEVDQGVGGSSNEPKPS